MLLERTISQLDIGSVPRERAEELAELGYMQWLGALDGDANYLAEAMKAYSLAQPFVSNSPAVAAFCDLLVQSASSRPIALDLGIRNTARRGGAKARRNQY